MEQREKVILEEIESSEMYCKYTINKLLQRIEEVDKVIIHFEPLVLVSTVTAWGRVTRTLSSWLYWNCPSTAA